MPPLQCDIVDNVIQLYKNVFAEIWPIARQSTPFADDRIILSIDDAFDYCFARYERAVIFKLIAIVSIEDEDDQEQELSLQL